MPSSRLRKPASRRPSGDQFHALKIWPSPGNGGSFSGVCAPQGLPGSIRNVFKPNSVYARYLPSADHTGQATLLPATLVIWRKSLPLASTVQISHSPLRVEKNAIRLPSGDQRGPRLRWSPLVSCRRPVPSALVTNRCSSCSVELKARHLPSGESAGRDTPLELCTISFGSLTTTSRTGSNRTALNRPLVTSCTYAICRPSPEKLRCAGEDAGTRM